jgi:hypothetical protein
MRDMNVCGVGVGGFSSNEMEQSGARESETTRAEIGVRWARASLCNGGCFGLTCSIELFDMNIIDVELQLSLSWIWGSRLRVRWLMDRAG